MAKITAAQLRASTQSPLARRHLTYRDLIRAYCAQARPNEPRDYRLKKWLEVFADRSAWEIPPDEFMAVLDQLNAAGYANSTLNREAGDQTAIYNWAIKNRRRTGCPEGFTNPLADRPRLEDMVRRVHMSEAEIDRLLALAKASTYPRLYGLILAALTSGGRKGELRRMRWDRIDWDSGLVEIGLDRKSGQYRTLILTDALKEELERYSRPDPAALVFCRRRDPFRPYDERSEWNRMRTTIGRPDLHFHDLRHVATARLLRSGANLHVTSRVLGHRDARMVALRYGALEAGDLRAAVMSASGNLS